MLPNFCGASHLTRYYLKSAFFELCPKSKNTIDFSIFEKAKEIVSDAGTEWDIYATEKEFFEYSKSKGQPDNLQVAFLGFVRRKVKNKS